MFVEYGQNVIDIVFDLVFMQRLIVVWNMGCEC